MLNQNNWKSCLGPYGLACAPEELSGRRFFDAMTGPTWYVNATAYGHADLMDPIYVELNEVILQTLLSYYSLFICKRKYLTDYYFRW